jgi:3,4-dihydroxy 2-butanone 4-phosphate synthase/GTP cyclohydrolase II
VYGDRIDAPSSSPADSEPVLVRVHTHCMAGDVFGATLCDCHEMMDNSLRMIAEAGSGALVYLHNGARGFGIDRAGGPTARGLHRVVLHTRDNNRDTKTNYLGEDGKQRTQRTLRQVGLGGQILSDLGIHRIRLLTNTRTHVPALQGFGVEIVEQVRIPLNADASVTAR